MRRIPPDSSFGFDTRSEERDCGVLGEGGAKWEVTAVSLHDNVLFDPEECHQ